MHATMGNHDTDRSCMHAWWQWLQGRVMAVTAHACMQVPNSANGRDLLHASLSQLTGARRVSLSGDYATLHPSCLDAFFRTRLPLLGGNLTELCLHGLRLSQVCTSYACLSM